MRVLTVLVTASLALVVAGPSRVALAGSHCPPSVCSAAAHRVTSGDELIPVGPGSPGSVYAGENYELDVDTGSSWNPGNWAEKVTAFLTNLCFGLAVFLIRVALAFVTWAFTFGLAAALATPAAEAARRLTETAYARFIIAAVTLTGLYVAWAGLVRRRVATTMGELALALFLLGAAGVVLARPADAMSGGFALARSLTGVVIEGVSPCRDDGCGEPANPSERQVAPLTASVWELFVRKPWFYLEFGKEFRGSEAQRIALAVLRSDDPASRMELIKSEMKSVDEEAADHAIHASVSRLVLAMVVLAVSILVAALFFVLAGTVVAAQLVAVGLLVLAPLALLAGVVPGGGQRLFRRWAGAILSSFALVVAFGLVLAVVLVVSGAILDVGSDIGLLAAQGIEAILVLALLKYRRALTSAVLVGTSAAPALRRSTRVEGAARAEASRTRQLAERGTARLGRSVGRAFGSSDVPERPRAS